MHPLTEAEIPERAEEDIAADFTERMAETERRVFKIAYSVLANAADAEEVAQETFLRAFRKFRSLRQPEKFRAWVGRIAFRLALNRQRRRRRDLARDTAWHRVLPDPMTKRPGGGLDRIYVGEVRRAIDRLPEKLRAVLLLSAAEDMDGAEVAAVLAIPIGTVRSRLHLARKRLLEEMTR